jgi:glycosyltransferase involved in cell wall biosynthesis
MVIVIYTTMPHEQTSSTPFFSIVIPTLNEEAYLPKLLTDLTNQTFDNFEVIHVDGQSKDKTLEKASEFSDKLSLISICGKKQNVSHQRNLGAEKSSGKWVVFMDADNRLPDHFLQGIRYQIDKHPQLDAFTCWMDVKKYPARHQPTIQLMNLGLSLLNSEALGAMIAVKKEAVDKHQFNEDQSYAEDSAFVKELVKNGSKFECLREPRYYFSPRRFEKEGLIKITAAALEGRLRLLFSDNLTEYDKYPMHGGSYYSQDKTPYAQRLVEGLDSFFEKASKKQLAKAKKIWSFITDEDD